MRLPEKANPDRHSFDEECKCAICQNKVNYAAWQNEQLLESGWFIHFVIDADHMPYGVCFHTHGLKENFDHPDLQIVFNISDKAAGSIFWTLFDRIKEGEKFKTGVMYDKIISEGFDVIFTDATEGNRDVLRLIFPDPDNNLFPDDMDPKFNKQWEVSVK